jgi:hypothetical protein|nr:MAG TPA: hypothetical protein [Caudoviricetes sp.]
MLKIEKIKDEIKNFNLANDNLRCYLARTTTKQNCDIHECHRPSLRCEECLKVSLTNLLEEYKKPVKLSKFEYEYLKVAKKEGLNFIARDNDGCVFLYRNIPWKDELSWGYSGKLIIAFEELFKFVKWADEEPCNIDEILSNCEVIEDE